MKRTCPGKAKGRPTDHPKLKSTSFAISGGEMRSFARMQLVPMRTCIEAIQTDVTLALEIEMKAVGKRLAYLAGTIAVLSSGPTPAYADIKDYEFQLVQNEVKQGDGAIIAVRLLNKKTGKPVPDAVIFAKRIDMAPDGMATMAEKVEDLPSTAPGEYRFKTNLSMQGRWQLSLGAKVQGETGSVQGKLVIKALP